MDPSTSNITLTKGGNGDLPLQRDSQEQAPDLKVENSVPATSNAQPGTAEDNHLTLTDENANDEHLRTTSNYEDEATGSQSDVHKCDVKRQSPFRSHREDHVHDNFVDTDNYDGGLAAARRSPDDRVCAVVPNLRAGGPCSAPEPPKFCHLCEDGASVVAEGHCAECDQYLCSPCIQRHGRMKMAAHHRVLFFSSSSPSHEVGYTNDYAEIVSAATNTSIALQPSGRLYSRSHTMDVVDRCAKHREEKLRFFCKTCQQPVCRDCILTSHKHHMTEDIGDATVSARAELADMMKKLEEKRHKLESYLHVFDDYLADFGHRAARVGEMVKSRYREVRDAVESSYAEIIQDLEKYRQEEAERVHNQEMLVRDNIEDMTRLLNQQAAAFDSSILVLSQHEVVSHALKTLDQNMEQISLGQSEFLVSMNPRLSASVAQTRSFLGMVAFVTHTLPSPAPSSAIDLKPRTLIREVSLRRELAINICEKNGSGKLSSVRSIVETSPGVVWVATPRSILKREGGSITRNAISGPEDIANVVAGPGDKLLVSFGQGSNIKLYSSGSWSTFVSVPKGSTVVASRVQQQRNNKLQVYVAVTSRLGTTKVLSYTADGQAACQEHRLPPDIFHAADKELEASNPSVPEHAEQPKVRASISSLVSSLAGTLAPGRVASSGLRLSCLAVGQDGSLCLGDAGQGKVVMVDCQGQLAGQYRGQGGRCRPRSVCVIRPGQVVLADSHRSTVELISLEGKLLVPLLTKDHFQDIGVPTAVTVDAGGRLWVGTSMGHVCAYSFLRSTETE